MAHTNPKAVARARRKKHIRKSVRGTPARPRLCVFRSGRHIYAQVVDDHSGTTLAAASSLGESGGGNKDGAAAVGRRVAEAALAASVTRVVFDRNGFLYHGRVAALADAARSSGLEF
jgi:large subunit ribosomal protein L18